MSKKEGTVCTAVRFPINNLDFGGAQGRTLDLWCQSSGGVIIAFHISLRNMTDSLNEIPKFRIENETTPKTYVIIASDRIRFRLSIRLGRVSIVKHGHEIGCPNAWFKVWQTIYKDSGCRSFIHPLSVQTLLFAAPLFRVNPQQVIKMQLTLSLPLLFCSLSLAIFPSIDARVVSERRSTFLSLEDCPTGRLSVANKQVFSSADGKTLTATNYFCAEADTDASSITSEALKRSEFGFPFGLAARQNQNPQICNQTCKKR